MRQEQTSTLQYMALAIDVPITILQVSMIHVLLVRVCDATRSAYCIANNWICKFQFLFPLLKLGNNHLQLDTNLYLITYLINFIYTHTYLDIYFSYFLFVFRLLEICCYLRLVHIAKDRYPCISGCSKALKVLV